jgi:hypothetical protein
MASPPRELQNYNEDNLAKGNKRHKNYEQNQYGMRKSVSILVLIFYSKLSLSRKVLCCDFALWCY